MTTEDLLAALNNSLNDIEEGFNTILSMLEKNKQPYYPPAVQIVSGFSPDDKETRILIDGRPHIIKWDEVKMTEIRIRL